MMQYCCLQTILLLLSAFSCLLTLSSGGRTAPTLRSSPRYKAVNLGGWLVTEGWIKPSLFDGIPNRNLLDGTKVQLKSPKVNKYLCAEGGGGTIIVANRTQPGRWEQFRLWRINETVFNLRVYNRQFIGVENQGMGGQVVAVTNTSGKWETFEIVMKTDDKNRVRIKASNGFFLQVKTEELVTADFGNGTSWGDHDPSVFVMSTAGSLSGEFQLTNGYGLEKATEVLKEHWRTFIVEEDFRFISENGLNTVRIPVGWWIAHDPTPPKPFLGGSLNYLDKAFSWAEKHGVMVIIDLHAVPGSQNGFEHSASRDGFIEWGQADNNIQETVAVIDFLASRYARSPSLLGVELINEPLARGVPLDPLVKYYKAGYETVRNHSQSAYVIMASRVLANPQELFPVANGREGAVIDIHYYNLFSKEFDSMTVQQNIDFINRNRSAELNNVIVPNGPLIFIGEWVAEWNVTSASKEDYQRFAKAQLKVYGRATFGWGYWTLKNVNKHWSMEWMIRNKYVTP